MLLGADHTRLTLANEPGASLSVRRFHVVEGSSRLFEVNLTAVSPFDEIDISPLVGSKATFEIAWTTTRRWTGVIEAARFERAPGTDQSLATYALRIVPALYKLTLRTRHRLFQHVSIPAIVASILDEWKLPHRFDLKQKYPELELRTQYGESDFAFVSRLLEEAGITYFLCDAAAPDQDAEILFADEPHRAEPSVTLPFVDDPALARASRISHVTNLRIDEATRPGAVLLRDYDFRRARAGATMGAASDRPQDAALERLLFAPGSSIMEGASGPGATPVADDLGHARHMDGHGARVAKTMMESLVADRRVVTFEASTIELAPGTVLTIADHPRRDVSRSGALLAVGLTLEGEIAAESTWTFTCRAVGTDQPYRPEQRTPKPKMYGIQSAVVVGPGAGPGPKQPGPGGVGTIDGAAIDQSQATARLVDNEIYVDEHGRVRAQFPWDRDHAFGSSSSVWMRVSQGWAGAGYGSFTIPRVGHEVLVAYLDGDVDQPMVVGRVHNLSQPVPFPLPANKTVSTIRTATSPGGGGFNELRFDDAAGREHVYVQAQKDMDSLVKNDLKESVGRDKNRYVQNDDAIAVGKNRTKLVNHGEVEVTGLNRVTTVGVHRASVVGGEDVTTVGTRWAVTVARGLTTRLGGEIERAATGLGGVIRNLGRNVLSSFGSDPLTSIGTASLTGFGAAAYSALHDVASIAKGFKADPGPLPTSIEVVDRQIKLTTGEASIILDGPNVTIIADGSITFHAKNNVAALAENEAAIAAGGKVAVVSDTSDVVLQAQANVHLNPFQGAGPRPAVVEAAPDQDEEPEVARCAICKAPLESLGKYVTCHHGKGQEAAS